MSQRSPDFAADGAAMLSRATGDARQEFGSFFLSRLLGFEITYEDERCIVRFEAIPPLFNPQGTLHGGVIATALDISMGHLLRHVDGPGTTLEMKVQYMAPVQSGGVRCEAGFLRRGRSVSFLEARAYCSDGTLAAYATATWKLLRKPEGSG
ncbi:PaaI family thioesterase [Methylobacterium sp. E-046]|uniref:PaaI family thioesterase n=1 Tax=Methylobacterium sp. E-046 TaxID=2836576 RepID=UPI001FB92134|nr:PaaI family thioesterase [Methylobacterium sp. E-046]MCJ2103107.1 PaaI family thioesterase [Methylobacterium sp. E-046]